MDKKLTTKQMDLLAEVITKHRPNLLYLVYQFNDRPLKQEDLKNLYNVVIDEFMITGLQENSEPNQRGLDLEEIVTILIGVH